MFYQAIYLIYIYLYSLRSLLYIDIEIHTKKHIKRSKRREKKTPEKIEDIDSENTQKI